MKTLYLMRGLPGSGKSTIANTIASAADQSVICSTDDLWYDEFGDYVFDPEFLGEKHQENQRKVAAAMVDSITTIIVDNTNIKQSDIDPYLTIAKMFGYDVSLIEVITPLSVCITRNETRSEDRRVPESTIRTMAIGLSTKLDLKST